MIFDGRSFLTQNEKAIPPAQLSPIALAYIGDAVYELYIRSCYLLPPQRISTYHQQVVGQVKAETQAQQLQILQPHLTAKEKDIIKRGRNANSGKPRRLDLQTYRQATSFEALIGYLYLTDPHRLEEVFRYLQLAVDDYSNQE